MATGRRQIPAFGNWDYSDELPITQYFESAAQAGLIRGHYFGEDGELLKLPSATLKPVIYHHHHHGHHCRRKVNSHSSLQLCKPRRACIYPASVMHSSSAFQVKKGGGGADADMQHDKMPQRKKPERVCEVTAERRPGRASKAVDEDLYKIPPELLYQKPKRNWFLKSLWPACLEINCVA
ncbi:hypothetical protein Cni_G06165 [Canna indica]|uniref:Uncharacterized protein n=1 Tax=Canna indica TaxID=4628 RepID=A0AAQ3JYV7_9LILI|nr:hypothetical protein Cni_G06165 [Canna indica]